LDAKFGIDPRDDSVVWTDDELMTLIDRFVDAARLAHDVGFRFVDVKACHGYLLHEFLSARDRPGPFGGDLSGRSRLLSTIVGRIRDEVPGLGVVVRLSIFDSLPYQQGVAQGEPIAWAEPLYPHGFGVNRHDPMQMDLTEPIELLRSLHGMGVIAVNLSAGSPYYTPHLQRPAAFPPSDGYQPPEDPLVGCVRQIHAARQCKQAVPELIMVGTAYSYFQDYLPQVAQAVVRAGWIDSVGIGRGVLSYPQMPRDTLEHGRTERKMICRTFSDCTTAPRNGLISGCFPLDPYYKRMEAAETLKSIKGHS
jgi:2,4-dienoyl-CoA reductase-like NADH-dependent reductase (Old Yellow Enzyme family)